MLCTLLLESPEPEKRKRVVFVLFELYYRFPKADLTHSRVQNMVNSVIFASPDARRGQHVPRILNAASGFSFSAQVARVYKQEQTTRPSWASTRSLLPQIGRHHFSTTSTTTTFRQPIRGEYLKDKFAYYNELELTDVRIFESFLARFYEHASQLPQTSTGCPSNASAVFRTSTIGQDAVVYNQRREQVV